MSSASPTRSIGPRRARLSQIAIISPTTSTMPHPEVTSMRRLLIVIAAVVPLALFAQNPSDNSYKIPPKEIADVVDAPPPPQASFSPDDNWLLLMQPPALLTIADLSQPELKLAGTRFNPDTHDQPRQIYFTSLKLVRVSNGDTKEIGGLPASSRMRHVTWSPDSAHIAFTLSTRAGVELWIADTANASAHRVSFLVLNQSISRRPYEWMPDSKGLVVRSVPLLPAAPETRMPKGPAIQESRARKAAAPTYEDMLRNESDAAQFEYHMQSKVVIVPLQGQPAPIGTKAMIVRAEPSPDGKYLLVQTIHRPFSYTVPAYRFPNRIEI